MPIGSPQWMYASGEDAFTLDQSLRFEDGDSPNLTWTPSSAATSSRIFTLSFWFKRGNINSPVTIFAGALSGSGDDKIRFDDHALYIHFNDGSSGTLKTNALFRDPSAWYHIVVAVDTNQSTDTNRVKIYVNNVQQTSFATSSYPAEDYDYTAFFQNGRENSIGMDGDGGAFFDGYIAEVHGIDGTQLTPASFGETGDYGEWKPIEVSGLTYGTNGFYLSFAGGGIMSATGGDSIGTDGDYKYNTFLSDGTFTPSADGFVEYLVIGGGGGGGNTYGGGGGAGGYRTGYLEVTGATAYSITVGAGGARSSSVAAGSSGTNSVFSTITSIGGGGGGGWNTGGGGAGSGGSGGGASGGDGPYTGGTPTSGQGYAGGTSEDNYSGGGGGGAGAVGANGTDEGAGVAGGAGLASSITGSSVTRAGGGGSGSWYNNNGVGSGGSGGGGNGASFNTASTSPTANTGSGGGGGNHGEGNPLGTNGATGVVILRYKFQ